MVSYGNERIAYYANSPLAAELVAIVDKGLDAFRDWYNAYPMKRVDEMFVKDGSDAVIKVIGKPIIDTIKKHTGISLTSVTFDKGMYSILPNAWCCTQFREWNTVDDKTANDMVVSWDEIIMFGAGVDTAAHETLINRNNSIFDLIDEHRGTVDVSLNKYIQWDFGLSLGLFMTRTMGTKFIGDEFHDITIDDRLIITNGEIAAIILHELGHAFHMVRDSLRLVKGSDNLLDVFRNVAVIARTNPGNLPKIVQNTVASSENQTAAKAAVASANILAKLSTVSSKNTIVVESVNKLKATLICAISRSVSMCNNISGIFMDIITLGQFNLLRNNIRAMRVKSGELATTGRQEQRAEIVADSFATRHSMGHELAMGLSKMASLFGAGRAAQTAIDSMNKQSNIINNSLKAMSAIVAFIRSAKVPSQRMISPYPDDLDRCKFIVAEHMNFFKSMPRTPATEGIITQWVIAARKLDVLLQAVKNDPKLMEIRQELIDGGYDNTRGTFTGTLMTGNTHNDYRKLQDAVDDLIKSSAYYHAENFMTE